MMKSVEVRGDPHGGISSPGGGADQDQVFPCRVVSCRVVLSCRRRLGEGGSGQGARARGLGPGGSGQKSKKSAKIDKNQKCPE